MDGDRAPLVELAQLSQARNAWLLVDDAHGFGVLGPNGGGSAESAGLSGEQLPIYMATLGKALGCAGAFIAGSEDLIDCLVQFARTYIYTTALPPALAAATRPPCSWCSRSRSAGSMPARAYQPLCGRCQGARPPLCPQPNRHSTADFGRQRPRPQLAAHAGPARLWVGAIRRPPCPKALPACASPSPQATAGRSLKPPARYPGRAGPKRGPVDLTLLRSASEPGRLPLVLLHGWGHNSRIWQAWLAQYPAVGPSTL